MPKILIRPAGRKPERNRLASGPYVSSPQRYTTIRWFANLSSRLASVRRAVRQSLQPLAASVWGATAGRGAGGRLPRAPQTSAVANAKQSPKYPRVNLAPTSHGRGPTSSTALPSGRPSFRPWSSPPEMPRTETPDVKFFSGDL